MELSAMRKPDITTCLTRTSIPALRNVVPLPDPVYIGPQRSSFVINIYLHQMKDERSNSSVFYIQCSY